MKKTILLSAIFIFAIMNNAFAASAVFMKFHRGIINVVTSPIEIPKQVRASWIEGSAKTLHISAWLFYGLVKGLWMMPARMVSGFWDIVTAPVTPDAPGALQPPYVFDQWPKRQPGVVYHNLWDR